jgi:hypothetical protein
LSQELEELNAVLSQKQEIKKEYDKVIANTETAYLKLNVSTCKYIIYNILYDYRLLLYEITIQN